MAKNKGKKEAGLGDAGLRRYEDELKKGTPKRLALTIAQESVSGGKKGKGK